MNYQYAPNPVGWVDPLGLCKERATNSVAEIGVPVSRSANPLNPVLDYDAFGNEVTYRTMSPAQAKQFELTGQLPATTETSTAALLEYASGKYTKNGGITFRLTTNPGTSAQLQEIGIPVAMVQDGEIYHYHLDHLGTPRELSNQQGNIVWKARYKTYGNLAVKEVEKVENNLRFQGQYFDKETGLHYNRHRHRHRHYDPSVGQFTTQDPIGLLGGMNNYQYAPNPTGWVDPLGLTCKENKNLINKKVATNSASKTGTVWDSINATQPV